MVLPLAKQQEGFQERQVPDLLYVDDLVDLMLMAVQNSNRAVAQIYNGRGGQCALHLGGIS
jgi:nucleoside-diphosphate-sugar epimerase